MWFLNLLTDCKESYDSWNGYHSKISLAASFESVSAGCRVLNQMAPNINVELCMPGICILYLPGLPEKYVEELLSQ